MGDVDAKTLADALRRYFSLRWMYWSLFFGGIATLAALGATTIGLGSQRHPVLNGILIVTLALGCLICWLGGLVAWRSLLQFRCPRCGERFILSRFSSWPTSACKHCGLKLERKAPRIRVSVQNSEGAECEIRKNGPDIPFHAISEHERA
jgi:hypothetical protein